MKKISVLLLFALLVVTVVASTATPALAKAPWAPAFRLSTGTAYVFAYGDGSWFEVVGEGDAAAPVFHWVTYDDGDFVAPADPIPGTYDVVMQLSWKGINYGLVKRLPQVYQVKVSIPEAGIDMSYKQAKAYWIGVYLWDAWWVNAAGEIPAFNTHIGAKVYANRWFPPLTGDHGIATNLTAGKKLPAGTYTVYYTENWLHTYTGLEESFELVGDEWMRLKTPYHVRPAGESVNAPFTFTVSPITP